MGVVEQLGRGGGLGRRYFFTLAAARKPAPWCQIPMPSNNYACVYRKGPVTNGMPSALPASVNIDGVEVATEPHVAHTELPTQRSHSVP